MSTLTDNRKTWLQSWYKQQGEIQNKRLFDALAAGSTMRPKLTLSLILAYLLAALVHSLTLIIFVLGLLCTPLILVSSNYFICSGIGIVFLIAAWALRPRLTSLPEDVAARKHFKTMYQVADEVAAAMHRHPVDYVTINEEFNSGYMVCGWQRESVLVLGLMLWERLQPQERAALIAHELAHGVNGDVTNSLFIGTAVMTLYEWYSLLYPSRFVSYLAYRTGSRFYYRNAGTAGMGIGRIFAWITANIAWAFGFALNYLLLHHARQAEYLADALAAETAGTDAMIGVLTKIKERPFQPEDMPGLSSTHPPLEYRIEMLRLKPAHPAQVTLTAEASQSIDIEMAHVVRKLTEKMKEDRRKRYESYS